MADFRIDAERERQEATLKGLISSLLNLPTDEIFRIEILNPMQYSESFDTKTTVLDLKVHLNNKQYVLVEMQVRRFDEWTSRTLVYGCRQIADQAHKDFDYGDLQQVIQVSIMDYTLFEDHKRFFAKYEIRDDEGYPYTDKLKFYVMDLTAISQATDEEQRQGLTEWAEAFKAENWQEVKEIDNLAVKEAAKTMEMIMRNPTEREILRARTDAMIDQRTMLHSAERRGRAEGRAEGRVEGRAEGRAEGQITAFAELVKDGLLTIAEAAKRSGMTETEFAQIAGIQPNN